MREHLRRALFSHRPRQAQGKLAIEGETLAVKVLIASALVSLCLFLSGAILAAPATIRADSIELCYDDGHVVDYVRTPCPQCGDFEAVRFSPPVGASVTVKAVRFYYHPAGAPSVYVHLTDTDIYRTDIVSPVPYSVTREGWQTVDLPPTAVSSDFFVIIQRTSELGGVAYDLGSTSSRSYTGDRPWTLEHYGNGDLLIRAVLEAPELLVGPDQGFKTIQAAVDSASLAGFRIVVRPGIYIENVVVTKPLTIESENGAATTIVQAADPGQDVFRVVADGVTISGFTVQNATGSEKAGICLENAHECTVANNVVSNNHYGIHLYHSSGSKIYFNNFEGNVYNSSSLDSANVWNSTAQATYSYNGEKFADYIGNHWGDYTGSDAGSDGIVDIPRAIDLDKDNYPLVQPPEEYRVSNWFPFQTSNVSPPHGTTAVSVVATLQSAAFSDADGGDSHAASQWQITTRPGDYSSPIFDSDTNALNLTQMTVSSGILDGNTSYYWHVRYQDNHGAWSTWSADTSFITDERSALAAAAIAGARLAISSEESNGFTSTKAVSLLSKAENAFDSGEYESATKKADASYRLIIDVDRDGVANERDFAPYIYNNQIYAGAAVVVLILGALVLGVFKLRRESRRRQALEHQNREIAQLFDLTLGMTESGISSSRCGGDSVLLGALLILRQQLEECRAQYDSGSLSYEDARTQAIDLKQQVEVLISPTAGSEKEQVDGAQTHYEVLGIDPGASQEDIRRAYREKLKRLHPDTVAAWAKDEVPQEVKDFLNDSVKRLNLAYQMLSDPERRKEYDTTGGRSTSNG